VPGDPCGRRNFAVGGGSADAVAKSYLIHSSALPAVLRPVGNMLANRIVHSGGLSGSRYAELTDYCRKMDLRFMLGEIQD
jgi:hypothetical protein